MCARTVDDSLNNSVHTSSWSDIRQTGSDVISARMTSSGEVPVVTKPRRRGIPLAWRYSLPSTIKSTITIQRPVGLTNTDPSSASISGNDNEPVSDVGRCRPLCKHVAIGSRNETESVPRVRPTCLRYSYWLTLDDRRYVSKYSTSGADRFSGYEDRLRRHFRPRSCEIIDAGREPASCRVNNDDSECHVTGSRGSGQAISSSTSALDRGSHSANRTCPTVCLNPGDDHRGRNDAPRVSSLSDVNVERSRDVVEGRRRLSLSKIGDSGLGASIHSEQASPEDTAALEHHHHHQQQQQQQQQEEEEELHQRLSHHDDSETNDLSECQGQTHCEGHVQCHTDNDDGDGDDDRTKLTRYKCKYDLSPVYTTRVDGPS